ncbi:MAG: hypothetical protein ACKOW3_02480 [Hyphomicrobium sp.]
MIHINVNCELSSRVKNKGACHGRVHGSFYSFDTERHLGLRHNHWKRSVRKIPQPQSTRGCISLVQSQVGKEPLFLKWEENKSPPFSREASRYNFSKAAVFPKTSSTRGCLGKKAARYHVASSQK